MKLVLARPLPLLALFKLFAGRAQQDKARYLEQGIRLMNAEQFLQDNDDESSVQFSSRAPRHRSATEPDRSRAKRRNFKKRSAPCPVRGMAHRRNKPMAW